MKTSNSGIEFVEREEGSRNKAYKDSSGLFTIGTGHLIRRPSEDYLLTKVLTPQEILDILSNDLKTTENCINLLLKVPVSQNQFDALVSLTFNIGCGNLKKSSVLRFINLGETDKIATAWYMWMYDSTHKPVLLDRRKREYELFKK